MGPHGENQDEEKLWITKDKKKIFLQEYYIDIKISIDIINYF